MNETAHEILTLHVLPLRVGVGKPTLTGRNLERCITCHGHLMITIKQRDSDCEVIIWFGTKFNFNIIRSYSYCK